MASVRITSGCYKNRKWDYKPCPTLRPTSHRVRQCAFNILNHRFFSPQDLDVLDAFAGLGGYGFEALSLGARHATFVDQSVQSIENIRAFADKLGARNRITLIGHAMAEALEVLTKYHIIFMDPPYAWPKEPLEKMVQSLCDQHLHPEGLLILESPYVVGSPFFIRKIGPTNLSFYGNPNP